MAALEGLCLKHCCGLCWGLGMVITLQLLSSLYNLSGFTRRCLCGTEGPYENGKTCHQFHEWALKTGRVKNKVGKQRLTESDKSRN